LLRAAATAVAAFLFALATPATALGADILAADKVAAPEALPPYLSWLGDPQGEISVRDLTAGTVQERFTPLYKGIPLKNKGPVWFRLIMVNGLQGGIGGVPAGAGARLSMNLGELPPGGARIFYSESPGPVSAPGIWHSETIHSNEETLLPEAGLAPVGIYIRMEEMPGLWFSPVIGPQSAARSTLLPLDLLLPGIAAAAAVACLLRMIADRALWALWAAIYLICVLGQSSMPLPPADKGLLPENLPALLAPGLALIILPHVGRCMFRTDKASVLKDGSLYLCSLLGAVTAMLPLVPDCSWLTRLFPLWPLLLAPALPFCLSSVAAGKPGALAFGGAVFMPVLGSLLCLAALKYPDLHPAAARGGLWGLAVGGLGLALARVPRNSSGYGKDDEEKGDPTGTADAPGGLSAAFSVLSPQSQYEELPPMAITRIGGAENAEPDGAADVENTAEDGQGNGDAASGGSAALPGKTEERPEKATDPALFLPPGEDGFYPDLPSEVMGILEGHTTTGNPQAGSYPFNLHTLVRQVHDMVSPLAESKGLLFSWYMAPSLPVLLEGDSPRLRGALILLLQSAVQAADGGAVQLSVRRNTMSSFEGDLLFSISDNGSAQRTDAGFFLAWELASRTGGAFTVDYSPGGGTRTAFTVRFKLLDEETGQTLSTASALPSRSDEASAAAPPRIGGTRPPCILLAEMTGGARRNIARCLEGTPHTCVNAFGEEGLVHLAGEHAPALVIFDADMPENDIARCIAVLRADEDAKSRGRAAVLVLTGHELQAARLLEAGAGYVLGKPFTRGAFLDALAAAVPASVFRTCGPDAEVAGRSEALPQAASGPTEASDFEPAAADSGPTEASDFEPAAAVYVAEETRPPQSAAADAGPVAGDAPAGAPEPMPVVVASAEPANADEAKLPRPARLVPRGMAPGKPSGGTQYQDVNAGERSASVATDPASALGERLLRNPFLDPAVAFLRPTFTSPGHPPLREAVKPAMTAGQEASIAVSDVPQGSGKPAEVPPPPQSFPEDSGKPAEVPPPQSFPGGSGQGPASPQRAGAPSHDRTQGGGILPAPAEHKAPESPRTGVRIQVQPQPATAKRASLPPRKPNDASGTTRHPPGVAVGDPESTRISAHAARPGAVQVQLPPRHGIPQKEEKSEEVGADAARTRQAGAPHTMQISVHPSGSRSRGPHPPQSPPAVSDKKPDMPPAGAGRSAAEQAEAPRDEERAFRKTLPVMGGGDTLKVIDRAASDAAPMVMRLSSDDVVAPATDQAAPGKPAEPGETGRSGGNDILDLDCIRAEFLAGGVKKTADASPGNDKHFSPGSLIDFMLLDAAQDDDATTTGKQDSRPDGGAEKPAAGPGADAAPGRATSAAPETSAGNAPPSLPVPLAGLDGEFLDPDALPFLPGLADALTGALQDAEKGMDDKKPALVQEAAARMASRAEHFGLHRLGRLARCLERAAEAQDEEAARTILEDLRRTARQYEAALMECFRGVAAVGG
jgi:CheY-like chemotaxis protein